MKSDKKHRKWINVVIAVLVSFGLWLYVVNVENPTGSIHLRDLPVVVQGSAALEENGLMVTDLSRDEITVKVTGKRKTLMKLDRKDVVLTVDASSITEEGVWPVTAKVAWPAYVNTDSLSVSDWDILKVTLTVTKRETRSVPVRGEFVGTEANGFLAGKVETDPAEITLTGPAEELEQITCALAQVGGNSIDETVEEKAPVVFMGPEGLPMDLEMITASDTEVAVTVPVWKVVRVPLTVELIDGGGARASDADVRITPEEVVLTEPAEADTLPKSIELGSIDLAEVLDTTSYAFPIDLPGEATGWEVPETASVRVSLDRLASRSYLLKDIELNNVPYGFHARTVGEGLTVWVRGDPAVVSKLKAGQITAEADLSTAKAAEGVQRFPVTFTLSGLDEDAQADVVGTKYSVAVRLSR